MSQRSGNRSVTVGLGWLDGTAKTPEPEEVRKVIEARFGPGVEVPASGFFGRAMSYDGRRVRVEWDGRKDARGHVRAAVTQSALDPLGLVGQVDLLRSLTGTGYVASRLDEWIDDPERRATPSLARRAVLDGHAVTHARPGRFWRDDLDGRETYYLGRPGSDRMLRVYEKVDPDRTRIELQSRRDAAAHGARLLLAAPVAPAALMSNVVAFVDFRQSKQRDRHGTRRPRLGWWEAIVGDVARAEALPPRRRLTIPELAAWFDVAMGKTLAELHRELGNEWLDEQLRRGHLRLAEEEAETWAVA
jgi:Replication initiation factor